MSWFKFGGIRGLIGFAVAIIQYLTLKAILLPSFLPGMQELSFGANLHTANLQYVNTTITASMIQQAQDSPAVGVVSFIAAVAIAYVAMGLAYYVGIRIVDFLELKTEGFWRAAAAGILGVLVLGSIAVLIAIMFYSSLIGQICPLPDGNCARIISGYIAALIASIPVALIAEVGYAAVTWQLYKQIGWKLPE